MMRLLEVLDKANGYFFSESSLSSSTDVTGAGEQSSTLYPLLYNCHHYHSHAHTSTRAHTHTHSIMTSINGHIYNYLANCNYRRRGNIPWAKYSRFQCH